MVSSRVLLVKAIGAEKAVEYAHCMGGSPRTITEAPEDARSVAHSDIPRTSRIGWACLRVYKRLGAKPRSSRKGIAIWLWMFRVLARATVRSGANVDDDPNHAAPRDRFASS